jgi:quinol-cytochrome oxidoreductase complex cytochrome b subunit
MQTPADVVPEWYFLLYYGILRSIPHKTLGILAMLGSLFVLFLIPFINTSLIRNTTFIDLCLKYAFGSLLLILLS